MARAGSDTYAPPFTTGLLRPAPKGASSTGCTPCGSRKSCATPVLQKPYAPYTLLWGGKNAHSPPPTGISRLKQPRNKLNSCTLREFAEEGNGKPLEYSCLGNPMDGGAWWAAARGGRKESDTTERLHFHYTSLQKFSGASVGREPACQAGDAGSRPGEGNGSPLQYPCLENPVGRGAWRAAARGGRNSARLNNNTAEEGVGVGCPGARPTSERKWGLLPPASSGAPPASWVVQAVRGVGPPISQEGDTVGLIVNNRGRRI